MTTDLPFELTALANCANYQGWVFRTVEPHLGKRILEIGAGIGNMSQWLPLRERLILTETDPFLMTSLARSMETSPVLNDPRVSVKSFDLLKDDIEWLRAEALDTIVSFNVLEHIEDDVQAFSRLVQIISGTHSNRKTTTPRRLVTFVPGHSWAYGSLDATYGHFRRYSKSQFKDLARKVAPEAKVSFRYFNTPGLLGWILNGRILRKKQIEMSAIQTMEKLCPYFMGVDDFIHSKLKLPLGQSLLAVVEWT